MPLLTLCQAAKAAKKSKSTLLAAINSGRLSAFKNKKGQWQIDSDDLFRLYPLTGQKPDEKTGLDLSRPSEGTILLRQQIEFYKQLITELKGERDDLRRRLNEETDERRKLTALLTKIFDDHVLCTWPNASKKKEEQHFPADTQAISSLDETTHPPRNELMDVVMTRPMYADPAAENDEEDFPADTQEISSLDETAYPLHSELLDVINNRKTLVFEKSEEPLAENDEEDFPADTQEISPSDEEPSYYHSELLDIINTRLAETNRFIYTERSKR